VLISFIDCVILFVFAATVGVSVGKPFGRLAISLYTFALVIIYVLWQREHAPALSEFLRVYSLWALASLIGVYVGRVGIQFLEERS
jgi:hypothetical protein